MKKHADKKRTAEQIWLAYFNQALFEKGLITEKERNRLALKIEQRQDIAPSVK